MYNEYEFIFIMTTTLYVQSRSADTRSRLQGAFKQLLEEAPYEEIGIKDITDRADCSVGVFYRHFDDKLALLRALFDEYSQERADLRSTYLAPENWQGLSLQQTVQKLVRSTLATYQKRPGLFVAFNRLHDVNSAKSPEMVVLYEGIEAILEPHLKHMKDKREAARFAFFLITSAGQTALLSSSRHAQFLNFSPAQLARQLCNAVMAYLRP